MPRLPLILFPALFFASLPVYAASPKVVRLASQTVILNTNYRIDNGQEDLTEDTCRQLWESERRPDETSFVTQLATEYVALDQSFNLSQDESTTQALEPVVLAVTKCIAVENLDPSI